MFGWFSAHYLRQEGISIRGRSPTNVEVFFHKITLNRLDIIRKSLLTMFGWFSAHYLRQEGISIRGRSPTNVEVLWLLVLCERQNGM